MSDDKVSCKCGSAAEHERWLREVNMGSDKVREKAERHLAEMEAKYPDAPAAGELS